MMSPTELLAELRRHGVEPRVTVRSVDWLGDVDELPDDLRREYDVRRGELVEFVKAISPEARPAPALSRVGATSGPLSSAQERLWFIDQLTPEHALYNVATAYRLSGPLDTRALGRALTALTARHEALRSTFPAEGGVPRQVVSPPAEVQVEVVPVPRGDAATREARAIEIATSISAQRFELATGPLLRAAVVSLADDDHILGLTIHHIATDGWSSPVLEHELSDLYAALAAGRPEPALPPLPVQYLDYAIWQRECLRDDALDLHRLYWRTRLAGVPELALPADRQRHREPSFAGGRARFVLPAQTASELRELCRARRLTPFMVLLAGLAAVLHRVSGQELVTVGLPVSNRNRTELEGLIGFFVNSVALVADFTDDPTFAETLARVREATLEALVFQDLPFEKLVEELRPSRDLARNPIFSVMFSHVPPSPAGLRLTGAAVRPMYLERGDTKLDLIVETQEVDGDIRVSAEYSAELFEPATAERLLRQFGILLGAALRAPDTRVSRLPMQDERERRAVVANFNRTASPYPRDESLAHLFRAQARRSPDRVAVEHHEREVTYGQLEATADALRAELRRRGVCAGDVVAIHLPRSPEAVALTLAVVCADAAYLPIAVEEPVSRVSRILAQTAPRLLVTRAVEDFPPLPGGPEVVRWDDLLATTSDHPAHDPGQPLPDAGGRAAYVMYTSGSTGTPKGIAIPHRAIARLVIAPDYVTITPDDRIAHLSNPAFDASTFEIWGALLNGARLVVIDRDEVLDPGVLVRRLRGDGVTVAFFTTALFNELAAVEPPAFSTLRYVLFGGEAVAVDRVRRVLAHGRPEHLVHVYGPTESTTFAAAYEVDRVADDAATIPIGRPISRTSCYILDRHGEPAAIGVPGELCIGGDGLAIGYVGAGPELDARFVEDRLGDTPGARLYRTGDQARWRPDGTIEFLGRLDDQLKVRGFRVEPGEVEAALRRHEHVGEAVVIARHRPARGTDLVAFVAADGEAPASADLRRFARQHLPAYMMPTDFVVLPKLPRTANGKLDRAALAALEVSRPTSAPPETPLERAAAAILAEALELDEVGRDDDFFSLGGHSLLAVRAVNAIAARFDVPFTLRHFFLAPTAHAIATTVLALRLARLSRAEQERVLADAAGDQTPPETR